jgi:hypothetical protein
VRAVTAFLEHVHAQYAAAREAQKA